MICGGKMTKAKNIHIHFFFLISLISLFSGLIFTSCKKEAEPLNQADIIEIELNDADIESEASIFSDIQMWHAVNKRILVLFGYDFNYYPVADNLKVYLEKQYGLDKDDGLIYPIVYPEGFKHGGRNYSSDLFAVLNDDSVEFAGIVILGAPENTHLALARLQDVWGGKVPYPVVALFPQDEVLGLESTCDFVIDKNQNGSVKNDNDLSEENSEFLEDTPVILSNIIDYLLAVDSSFTRNSDILVHVNQALKNRSVQHFVDPESGIPSVNHFVLN